MKKAGLFTITLILSSSILFLNSKHKSEDIPCVQVDMRNNIYEKSVDIDNWSRAEIEFKKIIDQETRTSTNIFMKNFIHLALYIPPVICAIIIERNKSLSEIQRISKKNIIFLHILEFVLTIIPGIAYKKIKSIQKNKVYLRKIKNILKDFDNKIKQMPIELRETMFTIYSNWKAKHLTISGKGAKKYVKKLSKSKLITEIRSFITEEIYYKKYQNELIKSSRALAFEDEYVIPVSTFIAYWLARILIANRRKIKETLVEIPKKLDDKLDRFIKENLNASKGPKELWNSFVEYVENKLKKYYKPIADIPHKAHDSINSFVIKKKEKKPETESLSIEHDDKKSSCSETESTYSIYSDEEGEDVFFEVIHDSLESLSKNKKSIKSIDPTSTIMDINKIIKNRTFEMPTFSDEEEHSD